MVFRLPTHLDSFIPPPSHQAPDPRPWRGSLIVSGMRTSDRGSSQTIQVTAVEADGDNRPDLWPPQLVFHIAHGRPVLKELQAWVGRNAPPLCTFMPDRHRDANLNAVNQATFRSLSRILFENHAIAVASWGNNDDIPGAGIVLYPAENSSSLLVGAVFLTDAFPHFVLGASPPPISPAAPLSPLHLPLDYGPQYHEMPSYTTSIRRQSATPPQMMAYHTASPGIDSGSPHFRQPQYRFPGLPAGRSPIDNNPWLQVKNEQSSNYVASGAHHAHYA